MSIDENLDQFEQQIAQLYQSVADFKNCTNALRNQKCQQIDAQLHKSELYLIEYKELLRQSAVVPTSTRSRHKQLLDSFTSIRSEFSSVKQKQQSQQQNELKKQVATVNIQYENQTDQLKDMNSKIEESILRVQINNQQIINQDEQLQLVDDKFTHIQSKAEIAGQLVSNMKQKENKSSRILQIAFVLLSAANIAMTIVVTVENTGK
ncbi:Hypothetical_protein [Hexamita inflata]|uniref:Hypothetical_protein n=1 Tax=Hexamita inflata TaxID=28002 RepID=A0AA86R9K0_9EUKA|nr:Hypothetical protein HINF_LOCUS51760 [Hexamita inflata]